MRQVWIRYIQTRDKILETFSTIPVIISSFHSKWAIYRYDVRIQHAFHDFLSLIFDSLGKLVNILIPHVKGMTSCKPVVLTIVRRHIVLFC